MSETPNDSDRTHNEAPAEGGEAAGSEDIRVHAEAPAEGADDDRETGGS